MAEAILSPGTYVREIDTTVISPAPLQASTCLIGPTVKGPVEIPTVVSSYNEYVAKFGDTFESGSDIVEFITSISARNYFSQGGDSLLVTRVVAGTFSPAQSTDIDNASSDEVFVMETLAEGIIMNSSGSVAADGSLENGTKDNLRFEIFNVNDARGTFALNIRRGDDVTNDQIVLETYSNLSLDPLSTNYIEKVIGNQKRVLTTDSDGNQYIDIEGEFENRSNYVRIDSVALKTPRYINASGNVGTDALGNSYSGSLPAAVEGAFEGATGDIINADNTKNLYFDDIANAGTQGLNGSDYDTAIALLSNRDEYRFKVITAPGLIHQNIDQRPAINSIISLVESRGDAIAVIDMVNKGEPVSAVTSEANLLNTSYGATYWPWVKVASAAGNKWAPASTVIPGVYAFNDNTSFPWFAPAGLTRGAVGGVIQAERRLTKADRDNLYEEKVNPIATFPGQGIAIFGQKTLQTQESALDRVNVRRLLIEIQERIVNIANELLFEQNTLATRNRFLSQVNPYLESVVQNQGLFAFSVTMDDTNNDAASIDRNELNGQIVIQPTRTVEVIILNFVLEPTGATFQ